MHKKLLILNVIMLLLIAAFCFFGLYQAATIFSFVAAILVMALLHRQNRVQIKSANEK